MTILQISWECYFQRESKLTKMRMTKVSGIHRYDRSNNFVNYPERLENVQIILKI